MVELTFNPIVSEEAFKSSFYAAIPRPAHNCAVILTGSKRGEKACIITSNTLITASEIKRGKYNRQAVIDLGSHDISFTNEAVTLDNVSKFTITIHAAAVVSDPAIVYMETINNVTARVEAVLMQKIQNITNKFPIEQIHTCRDKLYSEIGDHVNTGFGILLSNISIHVQADQKYKELMDKTRDIDYTMIKEKKLASAAKELSQIYENEETAILAESVKGEISIHEGIKKYKKSKAEDFDTTIKQAEKLVDLLREVKDKGIIAPNLLNDKMNYILDKVISSSSVDQLINTRPDLKEISEEAATEESCYAPFDD